MSGKSKAKTNVRKRPETVIKAKEQPKNNPLLIPEVQEEMKKELTTDEFLSSYRKSIFSYFTYSSISGFNNFGLYRERQKINGTNGRSTFCTSNRFHVTRSTGV